MKRRKIIIYLFSCVFAFCLFSVDTIKAKAEYFTSGYYTYYIIEGEGACITECEESVGSYVSIPASLGGYPVTRLSARLFDNFDNMISVSVPGSVYWIQDYCFYDCDKLTTVNLPRALTHIGNSAFSGCENLKNFDMPRELIMIGRAAFENCSSLEEINLPQTLTNLGSYAFRGCSSIKSVIVPSSSETSLGIGVFNNCEGLTKAKIENGITKIPAEMFASCDALETVWLPNSIIDIRNSSFTNCYLLEKIYFCGTENEWESVNLHTDNIYDGNTYVVKNASLSYHQFGGWILKKESDCVTEGEEQRFCQACGIEEIRLTDVKEHEYESVTSEPTCMEQGYVLHTCKYCKTFYIDNQTRPKGHTFGEWQKRIDDNGNETAEEYRVCYICNEEQKREEEQCSHTYIPLTIQPTCTEKGYIVHECVNCGDKYTDSYVDALGHDFDTEYTIDKYPTENENGSKSKHCKRCDEITDVTVIRGRITEYRYRDKETTSSQEELAEPWIWYNTTIKEVHSSYAYIYLECATTNGTGTSSGYTSTQADNWQHANSNKYCFHGGKTQVCRYIAKYTGVYPEFIYSTSSADVDYTKYVPDGQYWRFQYCRTQTTYDVHHYYKWTNWSDWSGDYVAATSDREVEMKVYYTDSTFANEEVNSLRLSLLSNSTDESMDCNNDGVIDLLDLVLMNNARESVEVSNTSNNTEPQSNSAEQNEYVSEMAYYDEKMRLAS